MKKTDEWGGFWKLWDPLRMPSNYKLHLHVLVQTNNNNNTDCPTFWLSKIGVFLNHWGITQAPKGWATKGIWAHFPQEKFEILMLWNTISSVLRARGQFLSMNWSLNLFPFLCLFLLAWLCLQELGFMLSFWQFSGHQFQWNLLR